MWRSALIVLAVTVALSLVVHVARHWRSYLDRGKQAGYQAASSARDAAERHGPALRDRAEDWRERGVDLAGEARTKAGDLGTRAGEAGRTAADKAGELGARASDLAGRTADRVAGVGGGMSGTRAERHTEILGRTLVVDTPADELAPLLIETLDRTALFDPVVPAEGERLAWVYEAMGTTRLVAQAGSQPMPDGSEHPVTIIGVTRFDVVMDLPQGAPAAQESLDRIVEMLANRGLSYRELQREFTPGPDDLSEGPRAVVPW